MPSNRTPIGTRVRLVRTVENGPTIIAPIGLTGTIADIDQDGAYWIKLDQHFPELDEWENLLQIWNWGGPDAAETYIEAI